MNIDYENSDWIVGLLININIKKPNSDVNLKDFDINIETFKNRLIEVKRRTYDKEVGSILLLLHIFPKDTYILKYWKNLDSSSMGSRLSNTYSPLDISVSSRYQHSKWVRHNSSDNFKKNLQLKIFDDVAENRGGN